MAPLKRSVTHLKLNAQRYQEKEVKQAIETVEGRKQDE